MTLFFNIWLKYLIFKHDDYSGCSAGNIPGGTAGNYIMYPYSQSGTLANNNKFSTCSKIFMSKVVAAVVGGKPRNCLNGKKNINNFY